MIDTKRPTVGFAFSGSGDRTAFYIGFLESLKANNIPIDYIAACSGASLVAAAFACGEFEKFKEDALAIDDKILKGLFKKGQGKGGIYSFDFVEELLRRYTDGYKFEDVRPHMGFVAVDIETGEQIVLNMGDIAKAARISCTLPGVFEPVKWGGRTLIDGGLLSFVPVDVVKDAGIDVVIGVNMRGTKHIFTSNQMTIKKIVDLIKKFFFIDEIESVISSLLSREKESQSWQENPRIFTVLGKSLDIAIEASKKDHKTNLSCDLMIRPETLKVEKKDIKKFFNTYYEVGKKTAEENIEKIRSAIKAKEK